ncbi:glycosyltransferase family 4 protein [Saliphagus sp. LR7]|uniref:glycosyltransferase family 4 protein n=1 Tax=Saliphagus sp. LR7 TaxID=2282654 RepID=UPI000DF842D6|nr:glycosyltransferase family 4 protein [Saliphagus sp. LR7]
MPGERGRIAVVSQQYPPELGGNASRVGDTARQLAREGWDVSVVAPPRSYPPGTYPWSWTRHERREDEGVSVHRLWSVQPTRLDPPVSQRLAYYLTFAVHATLWLLFYRKRFDAVVCTAPPPFTAIPGIVASEVTGKPFVADVGDLWIDATASLGFVREESLSTRLARRFEHAVLMRADRVLTTTDEMSRLIERAHGPAIGGRLVVVPNAVDTERFRPDATTDGGEGHDGATIVYTGNFGHAQDLESCVRAMAHVEEPATLRLIGDGDLRGRLEALVADLGLGDRVSIEAPIDRSEVPGVLAGSDIGIATLRDSDGLRYAVPSKTYEYMASGLPVVGTDIGALAELLAESGAGVVAENDPEALAAAFDRLHSDPDLRAEMGRKGRKHAVKNYDRATVARGLDETLCDLIESHA